MNAPAQQDNSILFPPGRIVQGDLYEAQDKDMQGNPLTIKTGANIGQLTVRYFFAVAIPKTPGATHFANEPWGLRIWQAGHAWWPSLVDRATGVIPENSKFAWKIEDGDDTKPNPDAQMRRNCDREGYPGCWVVKFSSTFATKIFDERGQPLLTPGLVKRGYWIETLGTIASNQNAKNPGIYVNHNMVAFRAPGKEIISGPDPKSVGFGRAALPAGVTAQPLGNVANMPAALPPGVPGAPGAPVTGMPPMPGMTPGGHPMPGAPPPGMQMHPTIPPAGIPTPVQPQAAFLQPPVPGAAPAIPAAPMAATTPPAAPIAVCPLGAPMGYKMANLNGARYESFRAGNWTDAMMLQNGHMVRL